MYLLGLHLIDWLILALYLVLIVWIALRTRKRIKTTSDFYQGNRSFGKILTAFLNFGNMTDAGQVAFASREIYRQGISGIWISNVVLFHTPFQWFISAWQRRARYIGPGDMFLHRYESKFLAGPLCSSSCYRSLLWQHSRFSTDRKDFTSNDGESLQRNTQVEEASCS